MSVDSLISIEPFHTYCMRAPIHNILSEGVVREDRKSTKNGPPLTHQRNAIEMAFCWLVDNGPPLNAGLVTVIFIPRHTLVARYYVIPFGVCPSVRPSVRPCSPFPIDNLSIYSRNFFKFCIHIVIGD